MTKENPGLPSGKIEFGCSAFVTITLKVHGKGHWGPGATVEEVMRLGGSETMNSIDKMLYDAKGNGLKIERVGEPEIGAVTWARGTK